MDVSNWQPLSRPGFALELRYPDPTPQGQEVERTEERADDHRGDLERVHVFSQDRHELYVELVRFRNCTPQDEYDNHSAALKRQFSDNAVSELAATAVLELPAWTYSLTWPEHERIVLLLQIGADTYRVIYDPHSELNDHVLGTLARVD